LCQAQDGSFTLLEISFGTQGDFVCDQSFPRSQDGAGRRLITLEGFDSALVEDLAPAHSGRLCSAHSKRDSDSSLSGHLIESLAKP